jgi:hypothetical protein
MKTGDLSRFEGRGQVWDAGACARPPSVPTALAGVILTRGGPGCNAWERLGTPGNTLSFLYGCFRTGKPGTAKETRNSSGSFGLLSAVLRLSFASKGPWIRVFRLLSGGDQFFICRRKILNNKDTRRPRGQRQNEKIKNAKFRPPSPGSFRLPLATVGQAGGTIRHARGWGYGTGTC